MMGTNAPKGRRKLSRRLFAAFFLVSLFAFLIAAAAIVAVSWQVYEGDAEERLAHQAEATAEELHDETADQMKATLAATTLADTRITLVATDGSILYDTHADAASMGNHSEREEIVAARSGGDSVVLRRSETTGADTLYAAVAVDDERVVMRLSETRTSLLYYLRSLLAPLALAALLAMAVSALLARTITHKALSPLLSIDLNDPLRSGTYEEIEPLLARIDAQRVELVAQNEQLEKSVSIRREFTGNVSHEMKSPLQVIGGYAELIESGVASPEDAKRFASLIRNESESMRKLIDDVLLLSKLDEDVFGDFHQIDVSEVCLRTMGRLDSVARSQGVKVTASCPDGMVVRGSEALVDQMIHNLLENAIRYGDDLVEVRIAKTEDVVVITVSDNGTGIPEDLRERVFERFYRVDVSRSRDTGGTGLGLAIVKHAAEAMHGTVSVGDSELGGAMFTVTLDARLP